METLQKIKFAIAYFTIPTLILVMGYFQFHNIEEQFTHQQFITALFLYYPALFFTQGSLTSLFRTNLGMALAICSISYVIVLFVWLNSSALSYLFVYAGTCFLGFGMVKTFTKRIVIS